MVRSETIKNTLFEIVTGDITLQDVDAIVNSSNTRLVIGGGVDGAIHRAGGPSILEECKIIGVCGVGEAVITTGGNLLAKYVIHTVGPVWAGGEANEKKYLQECYISSLKLAEERNIRSVAFPAISTGIYGYPKDKAAEVAVETILNYIISGTTLDTIRCCLINAPFFGLYDSSLSMLLQNNVILT